MFEPELRLGPRPSDAHKGDFGRVLLIAGSRGMGGAAVLAAGACLRSGVGLLTVAVPQSVAAQVAQAHPAAMTWPLPETASGRVSWSGFLALRERIGRFDAIAVGPGLGQSLSVTALVVWLWRECPCPVVLDADALNSLAVALAAGRVSPLGSRNPDVTGTGTDTRPDTGTGVEKVRVLTPHMGEFARLQRAWARRTVGPTDRSAVVHSVSEQSGARDDATSLDRSAMSLAAGLGCWLILKGPATRITDGRRLYRNGTGNPGMASGGSGDCLTGILAASLADGTSPDLAARRGCYVHGLAGDLAAAALGQHAMNSADLLTYLPAAWQTLEHSTLEG